jgi:nucleoside-diphosphate-sugar epimerase
METVMVTGGAGFIGSHLCESLLNKGYKVICVDNLITGTEKNLESFRSNPNFEFINADICNSNDQLTKLQTNLVFHLASPASPIDYQNHPEETLMVNSMGTLNMLKLAKVNNAKFLLASTSEIYGDPLEHPQKETYWGNANSFGPRACYDESKRFAEAAVYVYLHKHNLDVRIVRIFNTYGPRMQKDDGRVVSNFINWALEGKDIRIDGDGSQTRSFCYVSDLVAGLEKAMFTENTTGEIFNLGNPDEFTIKDLAEKIISLTGSDSQIVFSQNFRTDDPMRRKPDITKAKTVLGWEPKVDLSEGLRKTIEFYKKTS